MIPLGVHSPKLDAVRDLHTKRGRRTRGEFFVEGRDMVAEALEAGLVPVRVFVTEQTADAAPSVAPSEETFLVGERAMARISVLDSPPGILAVFAQPLRGLDVLLRSGKSLALLAGVGDPGNAGTLLRSAEIFGFGGAIFTVDAVEPFNPKVVRATMGAIFRLPIAVADPAAIAATAERRGYSIVAAIRGGKPLEDVTFPERCLIAIGHERHGLMTALGRHDLAVGIPQPGRGDSLNAAVAGGIIFYAFSQQCKRTI